MKPLFWVGLVGTVLGVGRSLWWLPHQEKHGIRW